MLWRALNRWLPIGALATIGCVVSSQAWAQAIDVAGAAGRAADWYLTQGVLGVTTLLSLCVAVWATREKGKAEDALRDNDKERIAEGKEIGKLTGEISRTMATLAAAMEAGNRTAAEGNVFRQTIAQAVENLEKSQDVQGRSTAEALREMRDACNRLTEEVRRSLPRGTS